MKRLCLALAFVFCALLPMESQAVTGGGDHWDIRTSMVILKTGTIGQRQVMLLGDSIFESFWWTTINSSWVINAGFGGIGIDALLAGADALLTAVNPRVVYVMVGINDCRIGNTTDPDEWWGKYNQLLDKIHAHNACPVVCTILPVEQGKPLGDQYFDVAKQAALNNKLYYGATARGEIVINMNYAFSDPPYVYMKPGYTYDGVHPYGVGQTTMYYKLESVLAQALARQPN